MIKLNFLDHGRFGLIGGMIKAIGRQPAAFSSDHVRTRMFSNCPKDNISSVGLHVHWFIGVQGSWALHVGRAPVATGDPAINQDWWFTTLLAKASIARR
jgi:hypothetical protein